MGIAAGAVIAVRHGQRERAGVTAPVVGSGRGGGQSSRENCGAEDEPATEESLCVAAHVPLTQSETPGATTSRA